MSNSRWTLWWVSRSGSPGGVVVEQRLFRGGAVDGAQQHRGVGKGLEHRVMQVPGAEGGINEPALLPGREMLEKPFARRGIDQEAGLFLGSDLLHQLDGAGGVRLSAGQRRGDRLLPNRLGKHVIADGGAVARVHGFQQRDGPDQVLVAAGMDLDRHSLDLGDPGAGAAAVADRGQGGVADALDAAVVALQRQPVDEAAELGD